MIEQHPFLALPEAVLAELALERRLGLHAEREERPAVADVDVGRIDGVDVGLADWSKGEVLAVEHRRDLHGATGPPRQDSAQASAGAGLSSRRPLRMRPEGLDLTYAKSGT